MTRYEMLVLLTLALLLVLGTWVRRQHRAGALEALYAESDSLVAEGVTRLRQPAPPPRINLNTASREELMRLPRIGPRLADRILALRARRGGFKRLEDLLEVSGIGPRTLDQLRSLVELGPVE